MKFYVAILSSLMLGACGGGGSDGGGSGGGGGPGNGYAVNAEPCPVPPSLAAGGSASSSSGVALNALTCAPMAGVKVTANPLGEVTTGVDGSFKFTGALSAVQYAITLTSPNTVPRSTFSTLGGAPRVFSLIPNNFDLRAFDEMTRPSAFGLLRWTQAPTLIVQKQVIDMSTGMTDASIPVDLTNGSIADSSYLATQFTLPDDFVAGAVERLRAVLPQLTSYSSFKDVRIETATPGSRIGGFERMGVIVIAWATNIPAQGAAGMGVSSGYYRNYTSKIPSVRAGAVFVNFNGPYYQVPNILVHEFGHALGYQHTDLTSSFMNRSNSPLPTDFDLQVAKIAYDRSPGSKSPDIDPSP